MQRRSIQYKLQRNLLLSLLLIALLIVIPMHFGIRHLLETLTSSRLEHDAESLISALNYEANGSWELPKGRVPLVYERVNSGHYFKIEHPQFTLNSRSLWDTDPQVPMVEPGARLLATQIKQPDEELLTLTLGFTKNDQPFRLWIAEDISALTRLQLSLELAVFALLSAVMSLGVVIQRRVLSQAFRQLDPITKALEQGDIAAGLELPKQMPSEIEPLVLAIQRAVDRSAAQISRSRNALGNLAHELKRPLQELQWLVDASEDDQLRQSLRKVTQDFQHLTQRELRRARISGTPMPGKLFRAPEDLDDLLALFQRLDRRNIKVVKQVPNKTLPYDRDDLIELLGNLIDNAFKYAKSEISIKLGQMDQHWLIVVEDDGQGVDESSIEQLTIRGSRLDENDQVNGSGLGIAISQAVCESYLGSIEFSRSTRGGLCVRCKLPVSSH